MHSRFILAFVLAASGALSVRAETADPLVTIIEGKIYVKVNGEPITGKDLLDLIIEVNWEKELPLFIEQAMRDDFVASQKIVVKDEEVEAEIKFITEAAAKRVNLDPKKITEDQLADKMTAIRRDTKASLGLLKYFKDKKQVPADAHVNHPQFKELVRTLLEKIVAEKGVLRDPKKLGPGEAVRVGTRGYAKNEVREFIVEGSHKIPVSELKGYLDQLQFTKIVAQAMAQKKFELTEEDLTFHFSYNCRLKEAETGVPGREVIVQRLKQQGMTVRDYMETRIFKSDAALTRLAKNGIDGKMLRAEFNLHPEIYKFTENLCAHVFVQVRDSDGKPYGPNWPAPGHDSVNEYVKQQREKAFEAAKPQVDDLMVIAKKNFEEAALQSHDTKTAQKGGKIGRIGKNTALFPPLDESVRSYALALKPGQMSPPFRSDYGWHIVKCLEKQEVNFDEASERVYLNLIHHRRAKLLDDLMRTAKVETLNE